MLQVVPRWRIHVMFSNKGEQTIWISDNHIENVMRQLSSIHFSINPLIKVTSVSIDLQGE